MKSTQQMVEEQVQRWQLLSQEKKERLQGISVVTISREPGSGGRVIAENLAEKLGFDMIHQEMIHQMAESANVSHRILETIDEKGINLIEETISSVVDSNHLWPNEYLKHLMKVVGVIGKYGRSVVVGRGANFILPKGQCLRIRVVAPLSKRLNRLQERYSISLEEAKRRLFRRESERRAFIRKYFNADISDPLNYDVVINTDYVSISDAVKMISSRL